jgi:IS30 family transposase
MATHRKLTTARVIEIYFCDPTRPGKRGGNETAYGLLHHRFPTPGSHTLTQAASTSLPSSSMNSHDRPLRRKTKTHHHKHN